MANALIKELSKLRKQSVESVENTDSFGSYKKYLHVIRQVEADLVELLRNLRLENSQKCLVLLCGSAGDGKSHLLSYLCHEHEEHLLDGFDIHNDATESSAPEKTSTNTLTEKLAEFNDQNLNNGSSYKLVVAINLGTLTNFLAEQGEAFSQLKKYVEDQGILSRYTTDSSSVPHPIFKHVNFSDFHIFDLTAQGTETHYLEALFAKVFAQTEENPFYRVYKEEGENSKDADSCPVRRNYEFFFDPEHRKAVINKLVEVVIKDKVLLSTRDILSFIYDILVHPDYKKAKQSETIEKGFVNQYIDNTTPMLLYENKGVSPLMNAINRHDSMRHRSPELDQHIISYFTSEDVEDACSKEMNNGFFDLDSEQLVSWINKDENLKREVYLYMLRLRDLNNSPISASQNALYQSYLKCLFNQAIGNQRALKELYEATREAVRKWDGVFDDGMICIDNSNPEFWILEEVKIVPKFYKNRSLSMDVVTRFSTDLKLRFCSKHNQNDEAEISIDYSLYKLIYSIYRDGYRPNLADRNRHTDFTSFVNRIIEFGYKGETIYFKSKSDPDLILKFTDNELDYEFSRGK